MSLKNARLSSLRDKLEEQEASGTEEKVEEVEEVEEKKGRALLAKKKR